MGSSDFDVKQWKLISNIELLQKKNYRKRIFDDINFVKKINKLIDCGIVLPNFMKNYATLPI